MHNDFIKMRVAIAFVGAMMMAPAAPAGKDKIADTSVKSAQGTLWTDPVDIQSRNLFYGPGGKEHQPKETTFTFVDEDHGRLQSEIQREGFRTG